MKRILIPKDLINFVLKIIISEQREKKEIEIPLNLKIEEIEVDFRDNKVLIQLNIKDTNERKKLLKLESEIKFVKEKRNIKLNKPKFLLIKNFNIFEERIMKTTVVFLRFLNLKNHIDLSKISKYITDVIIENGNLFL